MGLDLPKLPLTTYLFAFSYFNDITYIGKAYSRASICTPIFFQLHRISMGHHNSHQHTTVQKVLELVTWAVYYVVFAFPT